MRSSKREAKRIRKNRMLIGAVTIFVMLGGGLGIFASNIGTRENSVPYNDIMFELTQRGWMTRFNGEIYYFNYHPIEVEQIEINLESIYRLKETNNVILSFNPYSTISNIISNAQFDLAQKLANQKKNIGHGFNIETEYDVPIITCEDASEENIVIIYEISENTTIQYENYCIKAYSSSDEGFYRITDRIIYGIMNII